MKDVRRLIERRIGLDPDTLGPSAFALAVAERRRASGVEDPGRYAALLERDPKEFRALVDRLVVPETWFFRGGALFEYLAKFAAERIAAGRGFRALSLPCSTGEEPYSLAMALTEAGLPADRWAIDGYDLGTATVAAAVRGVYREFSFRQTTAERRANFFREVTGGWELSPAIRQRVRVRVGNGLDPELCAGEEKYDAILCRNLLIYLTPDARGRLLGNLERLLAADGLLGVGHAEPSALVGRDFVQEGAAELFLYRRGGQRSETIPSPEVVAESSWRPSPSPRSNSWAVKQEATARVSPQRFPSEPTVPVSPVAVPEVRRATVPDLAAARAFADAGRLDDALTVCRAAVAAAPSADGYALLGTILHARKEMAPAADAIRKALYLDPNHREALALAVGLSQEAGDAARADGYRSRLARLPAGGTS